MPTMKRINITLPDSVHDDLYEWAEQQGRPAANLAAFIVEREISEARERGDIKQLATQAKEGKDRQDPE